MRSFIVTSVSFLSLVSSAFGNAAPFARVHAAEPVTSIDTGAMASLATFDQLIDHNNPSLGTFKQRYWYSTEYWNATLNGAPVILYNAGEVPADNFTGYLDYGWQENDFSLVRRYMNELQGVGILIEHRYWGESTPYLTLTADTLQYLTVPQAIQDMVYFAQNVQLPFDTKKEMTPDKAPWVLVGGSYSGALTAWTAITAPGTFWAYHASSAPVQTIENYWQYYTPIQHGMAPNCSKDISLVIDHIDQVLTNGNITEKNILKKLFGDYWSSSRDDDFVLPLVILGPDQWQEDVSKLLSFCDSIENVTSLSLVVPDENGVGLEIALIGYSNYVNPNWWNANSYDPNMYWYTHNAYDPLAYGGRAWQWMLCNEALGYWQTGAPAGQPSLASRLLTPEYYQRQCSLYFPGIEFNTTEDEHNIKYGGWDITNTTRLMFSNGEFDPWRSASVSSEYRPGGPLNSTAEIPVFVVPGAVHCQDLFMTNPTQAIIDMRAQEVAQMKTFVGQWRAAPADTTTGNATAVAVETKRRSMRIRP